MKTAYNAEEIEDELNELKLRIAKMNARRNAQINLLQRNITDGSFRNNIYTKPQNVFRRNYLGHPSLYYRPFLYPYTYSSWNDLLDTEYIDEFAKKSPLSASTKDHPEVYKLLEQKVQSDVLKKLKRFVLDQEKEITDEFLDKLIHHRKTYSPKLHYEKKLDSKNQSDTNLKLNSNDRCSPFLKPINKNDNFYKRYNSFMKRILKPSRKITPSSGFDDNKKFDRFTSQNTNWKYRKPSPHSVKYFPSKINKPTSSIKSALNDLDVSYLRPWQKYSPIHRDYFADYESPPKNYRVPRDVDTIIRDMEFENRRTYPFISTYPYSRSTYNYYPSSSMKYDPYESDSYIRSTLPTWKQYYYTQKLRSKPSHEKFVDYYDPYRDFFYDAASIKSDDLNMSPNKDDSEINSVNSDNHSVLPLNKSYDSLDDLQIIDEYRDSVYEEIIRNLRNQQKRKLKKNKRFSSRSFTSNVLRNDRSLYNYRIAEPSLNRSYSWKQPSTYDSIYGRYNPSMHSTDDKWKLAKYNNEVTPMTENNFSSSKYNFSSPMKSKLDTVETKKYPETELTSQKFTSGTSPSEYNQLNNTSPSRDFSSFQKYANDVFPATPNTEEEKYQINSDNSSPTHNVKNDKLFSYEKKKSDVSKNDATSPPATSKIMKCESPIKEYVSSNIFENNPESMNVTRKGSIFENKQFSETSSPNNPVTNSPKKLSLSGNPPNSITQLAELNANAPASMSRKNSIQYPVRKGSIQTSSIEEESNTFPRNDKSRRYSKDQISYPSEMASKNVMPGSTLDKRLSYSSGMREPINEVNEEKMTPKIGYDTYSQYTERGNVPQAKDIIEEHVNRSPPFQSQNFESTTNQRDLNTSTNPNYQQKAYYDSSGISPGYDYANAPNSPNYNERYYDNQLNQSTDSGYKPYNEYSYTDHKNEYNDQGSTYPTRYEESPTLDGKVYRMDSSYMENSPQYTDQNYTTEKRPSNESYHATDLPRVTEYEKYQDEDYKPDYYRNNRNVESRGSVNQRDYYDNDKYRDIPQKEDYNADYQQYQDMPMSRPHRDEYKTSPSEGQIIDDSKFVETEPKSFENYSLNSNPDKNLSDQSYSYSGQNSFENTSFASGENYNEPVPSKVSEMPTENITSIPAEQKPKDRKKSLAVESSQESEAPATESMPKEVSASRRTSKAALTLAEQRKAANVQLADKNKAAKGKLNESKLRRTPSVLKTKPPVKKT